MSEQCKCLTTDEGIFLESRDCTYSSEISVFSNCHLLKAGDSLHVM